MSILTDLEKEKEKRLSSQEQVVTSAKQLIAASVAKENELLKAIGLDDHIKHIEKNNELNILNKQYTDTYEGKVYHIDELRKIGIQYRLFMKPASLYRGTIPPDLGAIILRMKEKHNLNISTSSNSDSRRFYIMAPPNAFRDYVTGSEKVWQAALSVRHDIKKFSDSLKDPMLIYMIDNEHYVLLHKWGKDFTITRKILGFFTKTEGPIILTLCAICVAMWLTVPYFSLKLMNILFNEPLRNWLCLLSEIVVIIGCVTTTVVIIKMIFSDQDCGTHSFSSINNWKRI